MQVAPQNLQGFRCGVEIDGHPDTCPVCHHGILPINVDVAAISEQEFVQRILRCPRGDCQTLFIAHYKYDQSTDPYYFEACFPVDPEDTKFSGAVKEISPDYCSIYNEAHKAELQGYLQVCGPGYRKALEFLIKDFFVAWRV